MNNSFYRMDFVYVATVTRQPQNVHFFLDINSISKH